MLHKLIDWSLENRLLVCVISLFLAVAGVHSMDNLSLDAIPDLSDVQVIVHTGWSGRDPQTIEDQVTYPITSALTGVANVRDVRGFSSFGTSLVYVIFADGTDPYWARSRVLEHLNQAQHKLPAGVVPNLGPDASAMGWIYLYTLEDTRGQLDLGQLRSLQDYFVRFQLESVTGVAEVASLGGAVRQYQVTVDPRSLAALDIPLAKVIGAIRRSNDDVGGRVIEMAETEYMIRSRGAISSIADLETVPVGHDGQGTAIRLGDVASVVIGPDIKRGIAEKNGEGEVVAGIVTMRYGENALDVIDAVKAKIGEIQAGLPDGVVIRKAYDRSGLIERSIQTLGQQLIEELLIVALVCVIFLWHWRSAMVSVVVLPLGILVAFIAMNALGINANIMSLGGIAIAIGAMVDASVVMVENFHKHRESASDDADHWEIVRKAAHEVGPALFFSLLVITISFLPVFALEDQAGRLFKPLAITKTLAMASAAVLTLFLMPVLMGFFVRGKLHNESANPVSRLMIACYLPVLRFALKNRAVSIGSALLLLVFTVVPFVRLGSEFMPSIKEGDALAMPTTVPGISSTEARRTLQMQDRLLAGFPEVEVVLGKIGRADTALDPAPLSMVETHITLLPEEHWPERIVERDWLSDKAATMLDHLLSASTNGKTLDGSRGDAAQQVALMTQADSTRWTRERLTAGATMDTVRDPLGELLVRQLATRSVEYLRSQGILDVSTADTDQLRAVFNGAFAGDSIPLRRTTFDELTKREMHDQITIPGMPNWWLMPIETRIGMLTTGMRGKVGIKLYGDDLVKLERLAEELESVLHQVPGTLSVIAERAMGAFYLDVDVDRERCGRFGLTVGDVQDVIETAIGGMPITVALDGRERIPVNVRYPRELRDDPVRLGRTLISTPTGAQIPLSELAEISIQDGPPVIKSENGLLLTNIPVDLEADIDVGTYVARAQQVIDGAIADGRITVPTGTYLVWSGQYQLMEEVSGRLWAIVPMTLALILMLIYFNTKDLPETLITMVTLPFALIGGVWLLYWLDYDLSVAVTVGFIALAGLAAETAILMHIYLDLAYKRHKVPGKMLTGVALQEAVVDGAVLRVRPKMMTVVTTILALVPIMWSVGAGAGPMKRMAAPMIGGLVTSTLHTLVLIPVYYAMLHEWRGRRAARREAALS
ncbi:MAG: Cu(I)/Ag(I) efflux system membrane protein CusA/SilA [Pseudohongiellaceae bacterium]|jgi:Cu(I)/Ag(I) efflux system membrane protein CusA/SilA